MSALTPRAVVKTESATAVTTQVYNLPTYVAGDVWILATWTNAARTVSTNPPVWTTLADSRSGTAGPGLRLKVFALVPTGSEGATVSMILSGSSAVLGHVYAIPGAAITSMATLFPNTGTSTVLSGAGSEQTNATAATAIPGAAFTTTVADTLLMQFLASGLDGDAVFTPASGFTGTESYLDVSTADFNAFSGSKNQAAAGSTGSLAASTDLSGRYCNVIVGIAPAAVVGGSTNLLRSSRRPGTFRSRSRRRRARR